MFPFGAIFLLVANLVLPLLSPPAAAQDSLPHIPFSMTFRSDSAPGSGVVTKNYSLLGPTEGERLYAGLRLIRAGARDLYFAAERQNVYRLNSANNSFEDIPLSEISPQMAQEGWPMGLGYDSNRGRILLVSLGGEGFIHRYSVAEDRWSLISSMNNWDFDCIEHHPREDAYYGVHLEHHSSPGDVVRLRISRVSPTGEHGASFGIPNLPFGVSHGDHEAELVSAGDHLVLLLEPGRGFHDHGGAIESRIYLLKPATGEARLTYRRVWQQWPPQNIPDPQGSIVLNNPVPGASYRLGEAIALRATASHPSMHIATVDFYAGEIKIASSQAPPPAGQTFVIEAEDFDFDGGKHLSAADTMPYFGGAYEGMGATHQVDYARDLEISEGDVYRLGENPNAPMIRFEDPAALSRGSWSMQVSYRIGWITENSWFNYTRNFPPGQYQVYAAMTHADTGPEVIHATLSKVIAGAGTTTQTLEPLGDFTGAGSGSWTTVRRIPLMKDGAPVLLPLAGETTLRFTTARGDYDYLLLEAQNSSGGGPVVHTAQWLNAPAGTHTITARTTLPDGQQLISPPVQVTVLQPNPTNTPPVVKILTPSDGAVFTEGTPVLISVQATDREGGLQRIQLFGDGRLLTSAQSSPLQFAWSNLVAGQHTLIAEASDNRGATSRTAQVHILVRPIEAVSFVERILPAAYSPGVAFQVQLKATPIHGTRAYAVEDLPPAEWSVSRISHGGVFDAANRKVKFGLFTDATPRMLTYWVTPPAFPVIPPGNDFGRFEFTGSGSINGAIYPIGGDRFIEMNSPFHPADLDRNNTLILTELTAYAAAWKSGQTWNVPPARIPANYVTAAATLWKRGESYRYEPARGAPPECWIPASVPVPGLRAQAALVCERSVAEVVAPGVPSQVRINIAPPAGIDFLAVEEKVPHGWTVSGVSHGGAYDPQSRCIRWGLFLDDDARILTYAITPPAGIASVGNLAGHVSFDGQSREIDSSPINANLHVSQVTLLSPQRDHTGAVTLRIFGPVGQTGLIEASFDLIDWTELKAIFLPNGTAELTESPGGALRFYRFRVQ